MNMWITETETTTVISTRQYWCRHIHYGILLLQLCVPSCSEKPCEDDLLGVSRHQREHVIALRKGGLFCAVDLGKLSGETNRHTIILLFFLSTFTTYTGEMQDTIPACRCPKTCHDGRRFSRPNLETKMTGKRIFSRNSVEHEWKEIAERPGLKENADEETLYVKKMSIETSQSDLKPLGSAPHIPGVWQMNTWAHTYIHKYISHVHDHAHK